MGTVATVKGFLLLLYIPHECFYSPWLYSFPASFWMTQCKELGEKNKIVAYIFRHFHSLCGTHLEKIPICAFQKGYEPRPHIKISGVKGSNSTRRMRASCLTFFSCFIQKCDNFYCQTLLGGHIRKSQQCLLLFYPIINFTWKLLVSAAFPHGGRNFYHRMMKCGNKPFIKSPSTQQISSNPLPSLGSGRCTITVSGDLQPSSAKAVKFTQLHQPKDHVLLVTDLRFIWKKNPASLSQMKQDVLILSSEIQTCIYILTSISRSFSHLIG